MRKYLMEHPYFYAPAFPLIYSSCLINIIFVNSFEYFIKDFNQVHSKSCATNGVVLSIKSFWEHIFESASLAKKRWLNHIQRVVTIMSSVTHKRWRCKKFLGSIDVERPQSIIQRSTCIFPVKNTIKRNSLYSIHLGYL